MACFSGYGYDNSYSGYFGGLTHHGYDCWCNAGSFGSAYDFGYSYSSYGGFGDFSNGFFGGGFNDFGYSYGWNTGLSLDSTASLPLLNCNTQLTDFSAFQQLCNNKKTFSTNNLTKLTLPTLPATPIAPAATIKKNLFTFGNCFQNFAFPQLRATTQKQPQKLEPPKLQQPLTFAQFPSFPNQIGLSTRLDFSTLTKAPQATQTLAPAPAPAPTALPQFAFPAAAALPQFAFPTAPAPTAAPAPKPATLPQNAFPTAGYQFPIQQMYISPWGTWPQAAPAAAVPAPSITLAKPAKSGKEAKPVKTIRESPANTIETELQKRVDEAAPATRTIKELPAKSIVDDKSKNLKLIEGIILASKNQGRRFATDGSLDLADILDFYEFLREKKRRINIAKLLD